MASVPVMPSGAVFSGGVFAGFLTINELAGGVRITSADSQSHSGQSELFDMTAAAPDTDGDRMPDAWESAHGLNSSTNDAAGDPDRDGLNNLTEYYAGTDPRSAASSLSITGWSASPAPQLGLTWLAQPDRLYRIQYSAGLSSWSRLPAQVHIPSTAGPHTAVFFPPPGAEARGYYRVELVLPP